MVAATPQPLVQNLVARIEICATGSQRRIVMTISEQYRSSMMAGMAIMVGLFILLVTANAAQAQTFQVLHTFTGGADGAYPVGG
jgi:hypothetical protein